jgi:hypothetical protein
MAGDCALNGLPRRRLDGSIVLDPLCGHPNRTVDVADPPQPLAD